MDGQHVKEENLPHKTYPIQCVLEIGEKLHLNSRSADTHFAFGCSNGTKKRLPAHKNILAAASDVFDKMFYGELKENGDINITDVSEAEFMEFLQFFYLHEVKLTERNIVGVMHLGHKYNFTKCVKVCEQFLMDTLTADNIFITLNMAILYDRCELIKFCDKFIIVNSVVVLGSAGFLDCDRLILEHILKMNLLSCSEGDLFEACMAWVKEKSQQSALSRDLVDTHLGKLFYEIRFASMTMKELCTLATKYSTVLQSDMSTIMTMISLPGFQSGIFNQHPRKIEWNEMAVIKCDRVVENEPIYQPLLEKSVSITFSTNEPLLLGNFTCVQIGVRDGMHLKWDISVDVEIFEARDFTQPTVKGLCKWDNELKSNGTKVSLPQPILVRPGFFYKICISKFSDGLRAYCNVLRGVMQLESNITIGFHNCFRTPKHDKIIGLISSLEFNKI